ncbi:MAG: phosphomethylpyrimidine synthase ThiC [Deltaproteobacteria bacterium]|jgi:phosphomethylpyrimidine synthase|nr:phosphomethylpyrimidine synthase ThiC [Deltaproteobacteria bacterium]
MNNVKTQLQSAKAGIITDEMRYVAIYEQLEPEFVRDQIARGKMIIPVNINHKHVKPIGIGSACKCKINANIGNSPTSSDLSCEIGKLKLAVKYGADAVMDLSTGNKIDEIRRAIIENSEVPIGTVPMYEAVELVDQVEDLTVDQLFDVIERHAIQGVDFITVHCGLLRKYIPLAAKRTTGIVSRGGALTARWMQKNDHENPLYVYFDRLLEICRAHDMALSLGDGLRPGSLADASDEAQFAELETLGELTMRSREAGVQVMVEGPGHVPFNQIEMNIKRQIELCDGAPFYVLGPLVTDIAAGYDHINSAIGGTMAAYSGASMLCYVTPKEHLGLPNSEDVRAGVIAHKIAAHAADIALGKPGARDRDDTLSRARYALDWEKQFELMLDPDRAKEYFQEARIDDADSTTHDTKRVCSMCGPKFCAMKTSKELDT